MIVLRLQPVAAGHSRNFDRVVQGNAGDRASVEKTGTKVIAKPFSRTASQHR